MAKLPKKLIAPEPRRLSDLAVGETGYVWYSVLEVDAAGECYLDPREHLVEGLERLGMIIEVSRKKDGYHVTVSDSMRWQKHKRGSLSDQRISVASITVEKSKKPG